VIAVFGLLAAGGFAFLGVEFGFVRAAVAAAIFVIVLWLGLSYFRAAGEVPPDVEAEDVSSSGLRYVCSVCGLELKVEVATTDRAPTHCREPMVLVGGADPPPPLHAVD
jgi:hypothetical protein